LWIEASQAMFTRLNQITFADLLDGNKGTGAENCLDAPAGRPV
jgi:DNA-binding IscR family transcriptional regulator